MYALLRTFLLHAVLRHRVLLRAVVSADSFAASQFVWFGFVSLVFPPTTTTTTILCWGCKIFVLSRLLSSSASAATSLLGRVSEGSVTVRQVGQIGSKSAWKRHHGASWGRGPPEFFLRFCSQFFRPNLFRIFFVGICFVRPSVRPSSVRRIWIPYVLKAKFRS